VHAPESDAPSNGRRSEIKQMFDKFGMSIFTIRALTSCAKC
jgi:hypothetical protein